MGNRGTGASRRLASDTGSFWFFNPDNSELMIKVLDGTAINDSYWVYYGSLTNVEFELTVTDTQTGATKVYTNPLGNFASVGDVDAFGPSGGTSSAATGFAARATRPEIVRSNEGTGTCVPSGTTLCLGGGRFAVDVQWAAGGGSGSGTAREFNADTGIFWFFEPSNLELMIKVLDGTGINGKFWVFYGALSDVAYSLTVTDTTTGVSKTYVNEAGAFASLGDTAAFDG
jgi:hypothetical protein